MPTKGCADRLHRMQSDFDLSDRELKEAVKRYTTPREVKLPTFHEKLDRQEKRRQKLLKPNNKKRRYKMARWYLEDYLTPEESHKIYLEHQDFKELVEYAYQRVLELTQLQNYVLDDDPDLSKLFPKPKQGKYEIPEIQDREFELYAKKHPLDSARDLIPRRVKFQKRRRKRRNRLYNKRRMRMYDPLFASTVIDAKEMYNNLKRIGKENEIRCKAFHEMLGKLVEDKSIGAKAMKMFDKRTDAIMEQHRKRLDQFAKQAGLKQNRVMYDLGDLF